MKRELKISFLFALALFSLLLLTSCLKEEVLVPDTEIEVFEDPEPTEPISETPLLTGTLVKDSINALLLYNGPNVNFSKGIIVDGNTLNLETNDTNLELGKKYSTVLNNTTMSFIRTTFPIIAINTGGLEIPDEPKIQNLFDDAYQLLLGNNVYEREALVEGFPFNYSNQEIDFITS